MRKDIWLTLEHGDGGQILLCDKSRQDEGIAVLTCQYTISDGYTVSGRNMPTSPILFMKYSGMLSSSRGKRLTRNKLSKRLLG